jgi:hypothetical protein
MLDRLRAVKITPDGDHAIVEVEAGCHLGKAPYDPTGTSTWANSLNYQLQQAGYALDDLGGISQQTVSGFMLTGSGGGSLRHSVGESIVELLLIDGTGKLHHLKRSNPRDQDLLDAAQVSMGLLGVVAKVWFRVGRTYNISGQEVTTSFLDCPVDLSGDGDAEHPSLAQHLRDTDYCRLLWWPQHDFDRVQLWQARRIPARDDFEPRPFRILTPAQSLIGSLLMTILGNVDDLTLVRGKLVHWFEHLDGAVDGAPDENICHGPPLGAVSREELLESVKQHLRRVVHQHPDLVPGVEAHDDALRGVLDADGKAPGAGWEDWVGDALTRVIRLAIEGGLDGATGKLLGRLLKKYLPAIIDELLGFFVSKGEKSFEDSWMCGLPMDNQMDDQLWPTEFTELFIPMEKTKQAMQKLCAYYTADGDTELAYRRTRTYACELYAAKRSRAWLSPAYGADCFRVDPFWFSTWAGSRSEYFAPIWEELRELDFRPHWGKHLPEPSAAWRAHYRKVFPKLEDFLKLRAQLDPKQIFVSSYWREHLGIGK